MIQKKGKKGETRNPGNYTTENIETDWRTNSEHMETNLSAYSQYHTSKVRMVLDS